MSVKQIINKVIDYSNISSDPMLLDLTHDTVTRRNLEKDATAHDKEGEPVTGQLLIEDAEAWARGTRDGIPVSEDDITYQNNSRFYSIVSGSIMTIAGQQAAAAATSAENAEYYMEESQAASVISGSFMRIAGNHADNSEESALKSEGYAVGKQDGTDVPSTSPYYHNNAEYFKDLAEEAAQSVSDMTGATASADGTHGLIKQPLAGDQDKYFRGDGSWSTVAASEVSYDNTTSGLTADDTQEAIDEVSALVNGATEITTKAYAPVISVNDAIPVNAVDVKAKVEPIQSGSGTPSPENVRPISGRSSVKATRTGKNLFEDVFEGYGISSGGYFIEDNNFSIHIAKVQKGLTYTVKASDSSGDNVLGYYTSKPTTSSVAYNGRRTITENTFIAPIDGYVGVRTAKGYATAQIEAGTTQTAYEPFVASNEYTIQLGDTYYGGELDVTSGMLTVDREIVDLGDLEWGKYTSEINVFRSLSLSDNKPSSNNYVCSDYKIENYFVAIENMADSSLKGHSTNNSIFLKDSRYSNLWQNNDMVAFTAAMSGIQLVYPLATPITIQLTPQEIQLLQNNNTLYADSGDVSLQYYANGVKNLETIVGAIQDNVNDLEDKVEIHDANFAPIESGTTASQAYTTGQYIERPDGLYKVIADIASGASFTSNNLSKVTVGGELEEVAEDIEATYDNFVGTYEEWVQLSSAEKAKYTTCDFTDDLQGVVYGFHIDDSESDPYEKVTYLKDAAMLTPAHMNYTTGEFDYGSWEDAFFMPRPCMLKSDGTVDYYLSPGNYAKKEDGTINSDVANTSYAGNAMMEWGRNGKKIWMKIEPSNDRKSVSIYIADHKADGGFHDWPFHNSNGESVDHFYTAIYNGSVVSSTMRSLSGQTVSNKLQASAEITAAQLNGATMWDIEKKADIDLINALLVLMAKSTDTQTAYGKGLCTGGSEAINNAFTTGIHNAKGLFYGTNSDAIASGSYGNAVKVFGMENWWGFQWRRYLGHIMVNGVQKLKLTYGKEDGTTAAGFNLTGADYLSEGVTPGGTSGGYIDEMNYSENGMLPKNASGDSSHHYCDGLWFNNEITSVPCRGGRSGGGAHCGAFCVGLAYAASRSDWYFGAALSCKPLA